MNTATTKQIVTCGIKCIIPYPFILFHQISILHCTWPFGVRIYKLCLFISLNVSAYFCSTGAQLLQTFSFHSLGSKWEAMAWLLDEPCSLSQIRVPFVIRLILCKAFENFLKDIVAFSWPFYLFL